MHNHIESSHMVKCDLCSFVAEDEDTLDTHELFEHNFPCPNCLNIFRTIDKIDGHICKLEITNPTYQTLYTKHWLDRIFCSKLDKEVAILHCENCVEKNKTCGWTPYSLLRKDEVTHLESGNFIYECKMRFREILWTKLVAAIE